MQRQAQKLVKYKSRKLLPNILNPYRFHKSRCHMISRVIIFRSCLKHATMVFVDPLVTNVFFKNPIVLNTSTLFSSKNIKNPEVRQEYDILYTSLGDYRINSSRSF